jgi:hypothetical protein
MSISRLVLQSPFDIPTKPRAQSNNGDVNRSVNIMSDSRVVRRSTFNPRVGTQKPENYSAALGNLDAVQSEQEQYVLFDRRLINRNIFASPVTVIDVKENKDANVVKQKSPVRCFDQSHLFIF